MNKFLFFLVLPIFFIQNQLSAQATCATAVAVTVGTQQCGDSAGQPGDFPSDGSAPANPCTSLYNDDEYWFSITGDGTNAIQVDVSSLTETYAGVFILDDCPANSPNCVASVDNGSSTANLSVSTTAALANGTTYYIVIASWGAPDNTAFCLDVSLVAPPPPLANDSCQIAEVLPVQQDACTTWTTGDNTTATDSGALPAPSCGSYSGGDLWYDVTVPASGNITFDVQNVTWSSAGASLYSGTCTALAEENCTEFSTGWPFVFTGLTPGSYLLRVWDYGNNDAGTFDICAFSTDCSITLLATGAQTACDPLTNFYTQEIIVTYSNPPSTGTLDVNGQTFTITTSPQTITLTNLISDGSTVDISASFSGSPTCALDSLDLFTAPLNCLPPPANDSCINAISVTVNADETCTLVTTGSTENGSESMPGCIGTANDDVWFTFVATSNSHTFDLQNIVATTGTSIDLVHEVLSGTCGAFTSIDCTDPNSSQIDTLTIGNTYYVRVYSYFTSSSQSFELCIGTPPPPPPPPANDSCQIASTLPVQADTCATWTVGDNTSATDSGAGAPSCGAYSGGDMWFEVTVPASGEVTFDVQNVSWTSVAASLYSGTCGTLTEEDCTEFGTGWPFVFTGLTPGTYYLRTWDYNGDQTGTYEICAFADAPAACEITLLAAGAQTACDPSNGTYTQEITVTYTNPPTSGTLDINGQSFPIGTSPQTETLTLTATGGPVTVSAAFSADAACSLDSAALYTAPAFCGVPSDKCGQYSSSPAKDIDGRNDLDAIDTITVTGVGLPLTDLNVVVQINHTWLEDLDITLKGPNGVSINLMHDKCGQNNDMDICYDDEGGPLVCGQPTTGVYIPDMALSAYDGVIFNGDWIICVIDDEKAADDGQLVKWCLIPEFCNLTVALSGTDVSCNGGSDGTATATASNGLSPYTYTWSNGSAAATANGLSAGNAIVTVTDANGCSVVDTVAIGESAALALTLSSTTLDCNGDTDATATATVTGGTTPYSYNWTDGQTGSTATGLGAGFHSVTATDANGCIVSGFVSITEPAVLTASAVVVSQVSCNGGADGSASASATGGTTAYTYTWSNGQTGSAATGLAAGTYTVTVSDANDCASLASVTITESAAVQASAVVVSNVSCNGNSDGSANASATGGTTPYAYTWSNGQTGNAAAGLGAGTYTVTVTDANNCASVASVTITEPTAVVASAVVVSNVSCNGGADGSANGSVTGGTPPYTMGWSNGQIGTAATGLSAGTYIFAVADANNCVATAAVIITEPTAVTVNASVASNASCNGGADGSANATGAGGTPAYTYTWSNGQTGTSATGLSAGTYTVTLTDANNCPAVSSITITEPAALTPTATLINPVNCNGGTDGSASVSATGGTTPYGYTWSDGQTGSPATGLSAGIYTVTVVDANGCSAATSLTVSESTLISVTTSVVGNVSCNGGSDGSASASAIGGTTPYSYAWSNGQSSQVANGLSAGTHTVTVSDANGCRGFQTVTITEPTKLSATVNINDASCQGFSDGSATVAGSGGTPGYTYQWDAAAGSQTTSTASGLAAGTYSASVTDANGCTFATSVVVDEGTCDFCDLATNGTIDICTVIASDPNHPLATLDCDNGGVSNEDECNAGTDPLEPSDDCQAAISEGIDICTIIAGNSNHPLATADCDNGGIDNQTECANGEDPSNPTDDCQAAIDAGVDICALINGDPNHPLSGQDCDNGGVDNYTECQNGGDPSDPADDCEVAVDAGLDICLIIGTQPGTHPWTSLDCDQGGVPNYIECNNGTDPSDPIDDSGCPIDICQKAIDDNVDICAILTADPNHPYANEDCDDGGVDNATECANGGDPLDPDDDCTIAETTGIDICAAIALDPSNPLASVDCDNGGVPNYIECANGGDPFDPSDDCQAAEAGGVNICILINYDPNHPLSSLDCDNGGIDNYTECISGEDPFDPTDDCETVIDEDIDVCILIVGNNGNHPLATLDCDNGGVDNAHECQHGTDPHEPSDDCEAVILCNLNVCALIDGDPNHPLADQDCDGGGMSNWSECENGSDPNNPADDCIAAMADSANICAIINYDPTHPMASTDCDNGGIPNWVECQNGEDPSDPADDCDAAMDIGADICTIIIVNPTSPIATLDCDGGGVDNQTECDNGGNPTDPNDDCYTVIAEGEDICAVINGDPSHPMATLDCDQGGVDNYTECENGGDPTDPTDDCMIAKDAGVDICALIGYDPNHPLAGLDCDDGGVDNYTECVDGAGDPSDPMDDCHSAVIAGLDLCVIINGDPTHPWASLDCDDGGIPNLQECLDGGDPSDPIDDSVCPPSLCEEAENGTMDICAELQLNPNHPSGTLDCDGGGITNAEECAAGGDPLEPSDDCTVAATIGLDLCVLINGDPTHPLANQDCDGGGISNIDECTSGEDPLEPSDDCQSAIDNGVNICQIINYEPTHPMATLDCDGGGIDNWTECQNGGDPSEPSDDCSVVIAEEIDICVLLADDPSNPIGASDCDEDGVTNATECTDGTDPLDPCDFVQGSITLPVTADQSICPDLCPDLTPVTTILPGNIAGVSAVGVAVEITELNGIDTDGSAIVVRMPSDPRLTFTWDPTLVTVALTPINNSVWTFAGDNGIVATFVYNGTGLIIGGGSVEAFGFEAVYDPQSTDGQTTITASIIPFSGGECNILNDTDSERLVYFE